MEERNTHPVAPPPGNAVTSIAFNAATLKQPIAATIPTVVPTPNVPKLTEWNTQHLGLRLGADVAAAASAGALVAPIISIIDRGIIENASGRNTLGASIKTSLATFLLRPHQFIFSKPFALIFMVYGGTYLTANTVDTITTTVSSSSSSTPYSAQHPSFTKFAATSTANLSLGLIKDRSYTRMFGAVNQAPRAVPLPTFALFTLRDCLTIFASFNLPPLIAPRLQLEKYHIPGFTKSLDQYFSSASAAQFLTPAAVQIVSTPLHLLGLDMYNRQHIGLAERMRKVTSEWGKSCLARVGRIVPAFGVGGVVNKNVRQSLMGGIH
ncbi:hypothetical protein M501DRAFT_1001421 [Patellaria atrata CBS 101060]|uniref:Sequence orphan n=1 Tax=Patellaria atrata CBS 101060 TaxID=1346257 RepID=A0A9P4VN68_9PEZI|nr:hypothetical protein M501DRAFT_1001421 [Patellaria atrata CBS 101060]